MFMDVVAKMVAADSWDRTASAAGSWKKLVVCLPVPFAIAVRVIGYKWADDEISFGAPPALGVSLSSLTMIIVLPPVIVAKFGADELWKVMSKQSLSVMLPASLAAGAKVFYFLGVGMVAATTVPVLMQSALVWIVFSGALLSRSLPERASVLGVATVVTVAVLCVLVQLQDDGAGEGIDVAGFGLVVFSLLLDEFAGVLFQRVAAGFDRSGAGMLRLVLLHDVFKLPVLVLISLFFEASEISEHGVESVLVIPFFVGFVLTQFVYAFCANFTTAYSGRLLYGMAGTLALPVTYILQVAGEGVESADALEAVALVALTLVVLYINYMEKERLEAYFEGRGDALSAVQAAIARVSKRLASRVTLRRTSRATTGVPDESSLQPAPLEEEDDNKGVAPRVVGAQGDQREVLTTLSV